MSIMEKIRTKENRLSEIEIRMKPFVEDLSKTIHELNYPDVEITYKYIPYYQTFLFLLGSKYYTQDQCTLITTKKTNGKYDFTVNIGNFCDAEECIDDDEQFNEKMEVFLSEVLCEEGVKQKIQMYQDVSKDPFTLRVFSTELYLYLEQDLVVEDISKAEIERLKQGTLILGKERFVDGINWNVWQNKCGEVNGFVFVVVGITGNEVELKLRK